MSTSSSAEALYDSGYDSGYSVSGIQRQEKAPAAVKITTRLARSGDIIEFFGVSQRGTIQAYVAEMDGVVVGILGVVREAGYGKYFCDFKPELQPYLRSITILRAIKQSKDIVLLYEGPLLSVAETVEGCKLLNRLGFTHLQGALYGWLS